VNVNPILLDPLNKTELPPEYGSLAEKNLLVTGAAGFIGGALFKRLNEYGLNVMGTVLRPDEAEVLRERGYRVEVLDLASAEPWDNLLDGVDIVFNLAALFQEVEYGESMYKRVNVDGTVKLVKTAARAGVSRFVHCSTVGVHGHVKEIPCTEETPFNPMDEYHRSKLQGELAVLEFAERLPEDGMVVTVNRPSMVYGPGDVRLLKLFKTIANERFVMIGSGEALAHLGYIEDQTDSLLLGAVRPREWVHLQAFNIASGTHLTLNELAGCIANAAGTRLSKIKIPVQPVWLAGLLCELVCRPLRIKPPIFRRRVGFFTHNRSFDLTKARRGLNYRSNVNHREGISTTLLWYKDHGMI
jgi:nucleoside-diphosphate-sugar epimerase